VARQQLAVLVERRLDANGRAVVAKLAQDAIVADEELGRMGR